MLKLSVVCWDFQRKENKRCRCDFYLSTLLIFLAYLFSFVIQINPWNHNHNISLNDINGNGS
jgi:uncharacterized membrane protein